MSIFDKDISIPVEHLYDECKDVCSIIIPGNMAHYRGDKRLMKKDIIEELRRRHLFQEQYPYEHNGLNKICRVEVQVWEYVRLIPRYRVWLYYNSSEYTSVTGYKNFKTAYLTDFIVGINGVIGNGPMDSDGPSSGWKD